MKYLYHCAGCKKEDKEFPYKEVKCKNTGIYYLPMCHPLEYHMWARNDAYGIYTGLYCDKCYKSNYPYKKHRYYDKSYCGEEL